MWKGKKKWKSRISRGKERTNGKVGYHVERKRRNRKVGCHVKRVIE